MVRLRPGWLALVALLAASALGGCATDKCCQRTSCSTESSPAAQRPIDTRAQGSPPVRADIKLASFDQNRTAEDAPAPSANVRPVVRRPAEVIVAPDARPLGDERPSQSLDLATALSLTQGQNPRVAFAQAQIAQSLAVHEQARV